MSKKLKKMLEELDCENYIIRNKVLEEKGEYEKFLYINMLCTVIQYDNEPSKEQILFLNRIVKGIRCANKIEYYMRKAIETDINILQSFVTEYEEKELKYYFILDSIILINLAKKYRKNYTYLSGLIEVLGITKQDVDYISQIAKSILLQDSEIFKEAGKLKSKSTENLNFKEYLKYYFTGEIIDTDTELYIYSRNQSIMEFGKIEDNKYQYRRFDVQNIIFENLKIIFLGGVVFRGCESVTFKNCDITCKGGGLIFNGVSSITIESSKIHEIYGYRAIELNACDNLSIDKCEFFKCQYIRDSEYYTTFMDEESKKLLGEIAQVYISAGGFIKISGNNINSISITDSKISDLLIKSKNIVMHDNNLRCLGSFMHIDEMPINIMKIENSKFYGCRAVDSIGTYLDEAAIYCSKPTELILKENICSGGTSRLIETY